MKSPGPATNRAICFACKKELHICCQTAFQGFPWYLETLESVPLVIYRYSFCFSHITQFPTSLSKTHNLMFLDLSLHHSLRDRAYRAAVDIRGPRLCAERRDGQMDRWGDLAVLGFDPGRDPGPAPGPSVLGSDPGRRSGEMGCLHICIYIYI